MIRKILISLLLAISLISCSSKNKTKNNLDTGLIIEMEIKCPVDYQKELNGFLVNKALPQGEIKVINDSVVVFNFSTKFDSIELKRIFNKTSITFQETYNFERLIGEFGPILKNLADYGSVNAKNYLDFNKKSTDNPDKIMEVPFFGGSHIGDFSITDTSSIIKLIYSNNITEKLPSDLLFQWSDCSVKDSISLYLIKEKSIESGLSEHNITGLISNQKTRNNPTKYDKKGVPTKWDSETYYEITLTLDKKGAEKFYDLTNRNVGEYIAFNVNQSIFSAPRVTMPIEGGQISISLTSKEDLIRFYKSILLDVFEKEIRVEGFEFK